MRCKKKIARIYCPVLCFGFVFIVVAFVLVGCKGKKNSEAMSEDILPLVHGLRVVVAPVIQSIDVTGTVEGDEETLVISKTNGTITNVSFEAGDRVRAGAVLVSVENNALHRALQQAEIELANAKKAYRVNKSLVSEGLVSEIDVQSSLAQYYGALANHKMKREQYEDSRIKSPIDGYIVSKNNAISSGSVISSGTVVGRISKRDSIKIRVSVADVYVPLLSPGDKAYVRIPAIGDENTQYPARISSISSAADTMTGTVSVTVLLDATFHSTEDDEQSQFRTGLIASVELLTTQSAVYPIIPQAAIHDEVLDEDNKRYVYIVQDLVGTKSHSEFDEMTGFKVSKRFIQTGKAFVGNIEVHAGISKDEAPNTIVLISGTEQLFDEKEVLVKIIGKTNTF